MATLEGPGEYKLSGSFECGGEGTSIIKPGERFIARELVEGVDVSRGEGGWEVYLKSGISGTIPRDKVRLLPDEPLARLNFENCKQEWRKLQSKRIESSADDVAGYSAKKYHRIPNYYKTLLKATEGDAKAFRQLVSLHMDGEAGEENELNTGWPFIHVAGDDTFAKLLAGQPSRVREGYAEFFSNPLPPISNPKLYIKVNFPKTYAILYGK